MEGYFKNKYRISSARLKNYNYSLNGAYFITICTKNHYHYFGRIRNSIMELSDIGKIIRNEYINTFSIRKNVIMDKWVIMPNHMHIIIVINNSLFESETHAMRLYGSKKILDSEVIQDNEIMQDSKRVQENEVIYKNKFGPQSNNISAIIRGFKGAAIKNIRLAGFLEFSWQSKFYDHVIANENELNRIRRYIVNNPSKWEMDYNNTNNPCM